MTTAFAGQAPHGRTATSFPIARELQRVEQRLTSITRSREARLSEISNYLILSGGKRVRPAVVLLVYRACGGSEEKLEDVVDVAVALELIHSASLLHDDIIDGSDLRRGRDSALRKFGLAETLVAGDFLFGQAYRLCARFDEKLITWAVQACIALTEGEIMQGRFRHNPTVALADYLEIITRKTASLFEAGARTAAFLANASDAIVEAMARAGKHVGLAFQMMDDVIDITGSEEQIGKPVGIDLRDGNPSLPIVLAMQSDAELRRLFEKEPLTESELSTMLGRLRRSPAISDARRLASHHAEKTRAELRVLPESPYRAHLLALVDQLEGRVA